MKWEQRRTTSGGKTTIHLTDEAKKRLSVPKEAFDRMSVYRPPDYSRMPLFDRIVWSVVGLIAGVAIVTILYLVWARVFGGA